MAIFSLALVIVCVLFMSQGYILLSKLLLRIMARFKIPPQFMSAMFKELSILGIVSFFLFSLTYSKVLPKHLQEGVEVVHITLFVSSLLYIILVGFLLVLSVVWVRRFKVMEKKIKNGIKEERKKTTWKRFKKSCSSKRAISRRIYTALRRKCIETHGLTPEFNYYRYIRESLQRVVLATIEIDYKMWILVIIYAAIVDVEAVFWPFSNGHKADDKPSENGDELFEELFMGPLLSVIAGLEWALVIVSVPLTIKLRWIVRKLVKKEVSRVMPIEDRSYDKKKSCNSIVYNFRRCCCPCCLPHISETQKLFWFKSKGFVLSILQLMILVQSFSIAIILINVRHLGSEVLFLVLGLVPIPFLLFVAVPRMLPLFTFAAYSTDSADRRLLRRLQRHNLASSFLPANQSEVTSSLHSLLLEEHQEEDHDGTECGDELEHLYLPVHSNSLEEPLLPKEP